MTDDTSIMMAAFFVSMILFFAGASIYSIRNLRKIKKCYLQEEANHQSRLSEGRMLYDSAMKECRDMKKTIEDIEKKIDELRLQTGIISGCLGSYGRLINVPGTARLPEVTERKKPGPKPGSTRKPKLLASSEQST